MLAKEYGNQRGQGQKRAEWDFTQEIQFLDAHSQTAEQGTCDRSQKNYQQYLNPAQQGAGGGNVFDVTPAHAHGAADLEVYFREKQKQTASQRTQLKYLTNQTRLNQQ